MDNDTAIRSFNEYKTIADELVLSERHLMSHEVIRMFERDVRQISNPTTKIMMYSMFLRWLKEEILTGRL